MEERNRLSTTYRNDLSEKILFHFSSLQFEGIKSVLTYKCIPSRKEFDAELCSDWLKKQSPGLSFAWPKTFAKDHSMEGIEMSGDDFFSENNWGILEPQGGRIVSPMEFDLVLVPLLCFDQNGYRVGYGKGFYDRFFPRCKENVWKIGFSFFDPVVKIEDIDQFDVPLNHCITPSGIYEF